MKLIVSDSSPLIIIGRSDLITGLKTIAADVIIPQTVFAECTFEIRRPGAEAIRAAVNAGALKVHPDADPPHGSGIDSPSIDAGERAAIALARTIGCPLLIDERLGRDVARRNGVAVIGSAGLLIEMKRRGAIPAVRPILDQWRTWGYFLSDALVRTVLVKAGEDG